MEIHTLKHLVLIRLVMQQVSFQIVRFQRVMLVHISLFVQIENLKLMAQEVTMVRTFLVNIKILLDITQQLMITTFMNETIPLI